MCLCMRRNVRLCARMWPSSLLCQKELATTVLITCVCVCMCVCNSIQNKNKKRYPTNQRTCVFAFLGARVCMCLRVYVCVAVFACVGVSFQSLILCSMVCCQSPLRVCACVCVCLSVCVCV